MPELPDFLPPLTDDRLASRLAMGDGEFEVLARKLAGRLTGRPYVRADYERAIAYPWARPRESYRMRGGGPAEPVGSAELGERMGEWLGESLSAGERRYPVLTFGSNGAPDVLAEKLSGLDVAARDVVVLTGWLEGYEVAPSAHLAIYGALPATIVPSPGARVRTGVIMATATQFEAIARTEFNYVVERVGGGAFAADAGVEIGGEVLAFVSRRGALTVDGEVVGLAAVEGEPLGRAVMGQAELLEVVAGMVLGGGGGEEVVRRVVEGYGWVLDEVVPVLREVAARGR